MKFSGQLLASQANTVLWLLNFHDYILTEEIPVERKFCGFRFLKKVAYYVIFYGVKFPLKNF